MLHTARPPSSPPSTWYHASWCIAVALLTALPVVAQPVAEAIIWQGAGAGPDASIASLGRPVVLATGSVVFSAFLTGASINSSNDLSLWTGRGSVSMVCREGDPFAPAGPGVTQLCPLPVGATASPPAGTVRVIDSTWLFGTGSTTNDTVIVVLGGGSGSMVQVAREGEAAPDTVFVFDQLGYTERITMTGLVAFQAAFRSGVGPTIGGGIWAGSMGGVSLIAKAGDPATGLSGSFYAFGGLVMSPNGTVAFWASTDTADDGAFRRLRGGGASLVAGTGTGDPAGGGTFAHVSAPAIGRNDELAFVGTLDGGAKGVWMADLGGLRRVALEGEAAPDAGTFIGFSGVSIGGGGDLCFYALTSSGEGLFCELGGVLETVARDGSSHPALAVGETIGDLTAGPIVNFHGQVLFFSFVPRLGGGVDVAWWMRTTNGDVVLVAREHGSLPIAGSVTKVIAALDYPQGDLPPGIDAGGATVFNDAGQMVFLASFTDGSAGIFLSQPEAMALPEIFFGTFESGDLSGWSGTSP